MEPIAIIGLSFKLPQGAENEPSLWSMLENGSNVMTPWPETRGNIDSFYDSKPTGKNTIAAKGAHFMRGDPAAFDAPFFSITSKEAASMDPQQRWVLETSYRALENAGITAESVSGTDTAVFATSMSEDYMRILGKDPDEAPVNIATGTAPSIIANRALVAGANSILSPELSLFLSNMNFLSPDSRSYSFDHRANGYARGEGVAVLVLKRLRDAMKDGDIIRAVIRGSGSNQDGHTPSITQPSLSAQEQLIRQVYKNCGLDFGLTRYVEAHGPGTKIGDATELKALGRVFRSSRSPEAPLYVGSIKANIGHLEAASGLAGLVKSVVMLERGFIPPNAGFEKLNPNINAKANHIQIPTSCLEWPVPGLRRISVNSFGFGGSNGHIIMDDALGTIRALSLADMHRALHSLPHQESSDAHNLTNGLTNGQLANGEAEIQAPNDTYRNGGSPDAPILGSFLEEKPSVTEDAALSSLNHTDASPVAPAGECQPQLLVWSARDEEALSRMLNHYGTYIKSHVNKDASHWTRLATTLGCRRSLMAWRSFSVVDIEALISKQQIPDLSKSKKLRTSRERALGFVFTGQGAQYPEMGLELLQYPTFQATLAQTDAVFRSLGSSWSVIDELRSGEKLNRPELSQPLCAALQISLVELLSSFGLVPEVVVGHSSGEIAAAYAVGALSLESACKVAYHKGRLSGLIFDSTSNRTAMMSINVPEQEVHTYLDGLAQDGDIYVACINSPTNLTVSGKEIVIDRLKDRLEGVGIFARKLNTGVAYHSPYMNEIADELLQCLGSLQPREIVREVPIESIMISSVTGIRVTSTTLRRAQYWVDNTVSPVRFAEALQYVATAAPKTDGIKRVTDLIEVGPHGALRKPVTDTLSQTVSLSGGNNVPRYTPLLSKHSSPLKTVLEMVGQFFIYGYPVSVAEANRCNTTLDSPTYLVDLPPYPFDESQRYWHEKRTSQDWRCRLTTPGHLLGSRVSDWNPIEPRWRKILDVERMPWVADHVVGDSIFLPGTASLLMALEAVTQMSNKDRKIAGFYIKKAALLRPIVVSRTESTEVTTQLRPHQDAFEKASSRFEVSVFTYASDHWSECLKTVIHIKYDGNVTEVDGGHEAEMAAQAALDDHAYARSACTKHVSAEDFYGHLSKMGLMYGESFSRAAGVQWDSDQLAVSHIDVGPPEPAFDGIVHPAILDAAFQNCFTAPTRGMKFQIPTTVPREIHSTWISATGWQYPSTNTLRLLTRSRLKSGGLGGIQASYSALADDGTLLCHAKRVEMAPVVDIAGARMNKDTSRNLLHHIDWRPQLSFLSPAQLRSHCLTDRNVENEVSAAEYSQQVDNALRSVLRHSLEQLSNTDWSAMSAHTQKYVDWARSTIGDSEIAPEELTSHLRDLESRRPSWKVVFDIAHNLPSILQGNVDALDLMFSGSAAQDFYDDLFSRVYLAELQSFFELAVHQSPGMRILEVGAGTGGMTELILRMLHQVESRTGGLAYSEYVYTDISPGFFENAQNRFKENKHRFKFEMFNIEQDGAAQGFPSGGFDLILAGSVVHATKNLSATLQNLRSKLKTGGHLVFHEATATEGVLMSFAFGILPGWWIGEEDYRSRGAIIPESRWDALLRENGFSGVDMALRDYKNDAGHCASYHISTAAAEPRVDASASESKVHIIVDQDDKYQNEVAVLLFEHISSLPGHSPLIRSFFPTEGVNEAMMGDNDQMVFLAGMSERFLSSITPNDFELTRQWIQTFKGLLWVALVGSSPESHSLPKMEEGFLRVLRREFSDKRLVSLSLEDGRDDPATCVGHITNVFTAVTQESSPEVEYSVRNGHILTGRVTIDSAWNKKLDSYIYPGTYTEPWLSGPPLKLDISHRGQLESLHFSQDIHDYELDLDDFDVEIEAKAWAVNFRDVFGALGRLEETIFGSDCAGIVTRVGSRCSVRPGDRVSMCVPNCMRTYPRTKEWAVVKMPDSVCFEEACAGLNPAITSWHSLIDVARLQKGEKILIHAASGATGQVAVQIALLVGAEVFATVGYNEKKRFLIEQYGIPADHIFSSRDTSFSDGVIRVTRGYGVDVVLNSLVGEGLRASWDCIAPFGRFVEIGRADIDASSSLAMANFARNVTFSAVDLLHFFNNRKEKGATLLNKAMDLIADGSIHHPKPLHIYGVDAVEDAFRYLQTGKNTGRVIINVEPTTVVKKQYTRRGEWTFRADATYLIVGGLGGVGRLILEWMVKRGARHLLVPSRSGSSSATASELVAKLCQQGVTILAPACDVSCADSLSATLADCSKELPPIRGYVNAAVELNDSTYDFMASHQWQRTIRSKVATAWNSHSHLPDLDFFILLSSIAGVVGSTGQSNYAAGCTFQDWLAKHRAENGQPAISIDLGPMRTVGIVSESKSLSKIFDGSNGLTPIEENEFLALMDLCCDPDRKGRPAWESQVTMGLTTPADMMAKSLEPPEHYQRPLFAYFSQLTGTSSQPVTTVSDAGLFRDASSAEERSLVVIGALSRKLARALSISPTDVEVDQPLHAFGVDSLVALELRNWITRQFAADVPVHEIMSGKTVSAIGGLVTQTSQVK